MCEVTPANPAGVDPDQSFQERFWTIQRFAWIAFGLVILAGLLGITGRGGPLAHGVVSTPQGSLEYPRVMRWQTNDDLLVRFAPTGAAEASLDIDAEFFEVFALEGVQPQPEESHATADGQRLIFSLRPPNGRSEIVMRVRGTRPSLGEQFRIRLNDGPPLVVGPVVLP